MLRDRLKRLLCLVLVMLLIAPMLPGSLIVARAEAALGEASSVTCGVCEKYPTGLSIDVKNPCVRLECSGWKVMYPNGADYALFDPLFDPRTGSGSTARDIVGSEDFPAVYIQFNDDGSEMAVRMRVNNHDGIDKNGPQTKCFTFLGIDANLNGTIDFFIGAYNPTGSGRLGIYPADPASPNSGPGLTGIAKPTATFQPLRDVNYSFFEVTDESGSFSEFSEDADYFITFKFKVDDIARAVAGNTKEDVTFSSTTPFSYIAGTSTQENALNSDINGIDDQDTASWKGKTWNELNVMSPPITTDPRIEWHTVTFNKNEGDTEALPNIKFVEGGESVGSLPLSPAKRAMYFQGWNTEPDGSGESFTANTVINKDMTVYAIWSDKKVETITFDPNGGNWGGSTANIQVPTTDGIIGMDNMPPNPANGALVFAGWTTVRQTGVTLNQFPNVVYFTGNSQASILATLVPPNTVYALWIPTPSGNSGLTYAEFYDNTGANGDSYLFTMYAHNNGRITGAVPEPTRLGYRFSGWFTTFAQAGGTQYTSTTTIASGAKYYARWTKVDYAITYEMNISAGSSVDRNGVPSTLLSTDGHFIVPDQMPTREGYTFKEWCRTADGTGEQMLAASIIDQNTIVYAIWEPVVIPPAPVNRIVSFNAMGGEYGEGEPRNVGGNWLLDVEASDGYLDFVPVPVWPELDEDGEPIMQFAGWSVGEGGMVDATINTWSYHSEFLTEGAALYAVWIPVNTITFHPRGGEWPGGSMEPVKVGTDGDGLAMFIPGYFGLPMNRPDRAGFEFMGWKFADGTSYARETLISGAVHVYAQWEYITSSDGVIKHEVNYAKNDGLGELLEFSELVVQGGYAIGPEGAANPEREGYRFTHWYKDPACTQAWNLATDTVNAAMTLYAGWERSDSDDGTGGDVANITIEVYPSGKSFGTEDPSIENTNGDHNYGGYNVDSDNEIAEGIVDRIRIALADLSVIRTNEGIEESVGVYAGALTIDKGIVEEALKTAGLDPNNFAIGIGNADFEIVPADGLGLIFTSKTRLYNGTEFSLEDAVAVAVDDNSIISYEIYVDGINGEEGSWKPATVEQLSQMNAGLYKFKAIAMNPSYAEEAEKEAFLLILPRPLEIVVDNAAKTYGDADPDFVVKEVIVSDARGGMRTSEEERQEFAEMLGAQAVERTDNNEDVGVYWTLDIAKLAQLQAANPNYVINVTKGSLTIHPRMTTVRIAVNKDGDPWTEDAPTITLVDGDGKVHANGSAVPDGDYAIHIGGKDTGEMVTVDDGAVSKTLAYYTVSFMAQPAGTATDSAISATYDGVDIGSGDIVLGGRELVITASGSGATGGYNYLWSGQGTDGETTGSLRIADLDGKVEAICTVTGYDAAYEGAMVTITVNKDGSEWVADAPAITLVDENGHGYADLTAVPSGTYTIYANDESTGVTVMVKNSPISKTLEYHTVTFVDHDGKTIGTPQIVLKGNAATAPANPIRTGYAFSVWSVAFDNVTQELTVTAQYAINTYTVRFLDADGSELKNESVTHGNAATAPTVKVRPGQSFTGWNAAFDSITGNLDVTAQYASENIGLTNYDKYDKNTGGNAEADITAFPDGEVVVEYQEQQLVEGLDYDVVEGKIVFRPVFLKGLPSGKESTINITVGDENKLAFIIDVEIGHLEVNHKSDHPKLPNIPKPDGLEALVVNQSDWDMVEDGYDIEIRLLVTEVQDKYRSDVEIIASKAGDKVIGLLMDVSLLRWISIEPDPKQIKELESKIAIEFELPEELRGYEEYELAMVHHPSSGGAPEHGLLQYELFAGGTMLRIYMDRFSTVAILYKDKADAKASEETNDPANVDDLEGEGEFTEVASTTGNNAADRPANDNSGERPDSLDLIREPIKMPEPVASFDPDSAIVPDHPDHPDNPDGDDEEEDGNASGSDPDPDEDLDQVPDSSFVQAAVLGVEDGGAQKAQEVQLSDAVVDPSMPKLILGALAGLFALIAGAALVGFGWSKKKRVAVIGDDVDRVRIDFTDIDYPIVKAGNSDYSDSSNIYLDSRCKEGLNSPYLMLYGHEVEDGSMFAGLRRYLEEGYLAEHPVVTILRAGGTRRDYRIASVTVTDVNDKAYRLFGKDEKEAANYFAGHGMQEDTGQILALTTWANHEEKKERLLVIATMMEED